MHLVVVLAFALLLSDGLPPPGWDVITPLLAGETPAPPAGAALAAGLLPVLLVGGLARVLARWTLHAGDGSPAGEARLEARYARATVILVAALVGQVCFTYLLTGWLTFLRSTPPLDRSRLAADLIALLPLAASMVVAWCAVYPAEQAIREIAIRYFAARTGRAPAHWTLAYYLLYKVRHQFLTIAAPMSLVLAARAAVESREAEVIDALAGIAWAPQAVVGLSAAVVLLIAPVLLRRLWVTRPLPDGPLRARLEALCRTLRLGYREILVWESHNLVVNAAVMGLLAPVRYVLLSDGLLAAMTPRQIEAVFGHEAGHIRRHHLWYFAAFAVLTMLLIGGGVEAAYRWFGITDPAVLQLAALGGLIITWGGLFGHLSREFERQADLFGAQCITDPHADCAAECAIHGRRTRVDPDHRLRRIATDDPWHTAADDTGPAPLASAAATVAAGDGGAAGALVDPDADGQRHAICTAAARAFGRTLLDVAHLNGIPPDARSWRHGSIQSRCDLLMQFATDPDAVRRFERSVARIKGSLLIGTGVAGLGALWFYWPF